MSSAEDIEFNPRVELVSKIDDDELLFTLSNVNVSIANAIRRILLADIPLVVFRVSPNDKNKCVITANTCGLTNEIVKQRLSCVPIHIKDVSEFPLSQYVMELDVQNNTDTSMIVTTKDFKIKDIVSGKLLHEDQVRSIFPANHTTGDYIDFVRLKAKPSDEIHGKQIKLTCEFDIGTAKEDGAYNAVSTCAYGNTIDRQNQEVQLQKLKQKWKDEGKSTEEIKFEADNWLLLEGKRIFAKDSFDFVVQTVGIYTNVELVIMACKLMLNKLERLNTLLETGEIDIKLSENTIPNSYDVILQDEDYTLGKVIEYFLLSLFYEKKLITFCGFKIMHPHDSFGIVRLAYKDVVDQSTVKTDLKKCVSHATETFHRIKKDFVKLMK